MCGGHEPKAAPSYILFTPPFHPACNTSLIQPGTFALPSQYSYLTDATFSNPASPSSSYNCLLFFGNGLDLFHQLDCSAVMTKVMKLGSPHACFVWKLCACPRILKLCIFGMKAGKWSISQAWLSVRIIGGATWQYDDDDDYKGDIGGMIIVAIMVFMTTTMMMMSRTVVKGIMLGFSDQLEQTAV